MGSFLIYTSAVSRASGSWYDGDFDGNCMSGFGTLFSSDKLQFVQGTWRDNRLIDIQSCQFIDQGADKWTIYLRKQADGFLLTFDEDGFTARAQLCSRMPGVDFASSFRNIKLAFFRNLTITCVISDKLQLNRESALSQFKKALEHVIYDSINSVDFAFVLITLRKFLKQNSSQVILTELANNTSVPDNLRNAAANLLERENTLSNRRLELLKFSRDTMPSKLNVISTVHSVYADATKLHRQRLMDKCPSVLPKLIASISEVISDKIIYVSKADIEVFHHLASLTKEHCLLTFFESLHCGLFEKLDKIDSSCSPSDIMPLSTPVYGFLFKSFFEIISEISLQAENCSIETMLIQSDGKWKLLDEIRWNQDRKNSRRILLTRESLDCQYRFIFKLLRHFEPKNYFLGKKFNYDFKVMSVEEDPEDDSWVLKQFKKLRNRIIGKKNFTDMPEDRQVWLYILDHTIDKVLLKNKSDSKSYLELFKPLLEGHATFLSSCPTNSYESFRVVTHNILLFMIQTYPLFQDSEKLTDEDVVILEKQMKYISKVSTDMKSGASDSSDFRNLMEEYIRYWGLRHLITLDESNCPDYLVSLIKGVHKVLLQMVEIPLDKTVRVPPLVNYFRELNDFMEDFKDIDFPSIWYIKSNFDLAGVIEKIDNKIASETKCSYKVIDLKRFVEGFEDGSLPRHYIIHVVQKLLECARDSLSKDWISTCDQSEAQLEGSGALLGAMRSSFLYLKEQPDYRDFELFSEESIQPFLRVVNNCTVLKEFKTRVNVVKESFWYIRKMDEIGVVQALELFSAINNGKLNTEKLKQCYNRYLEKYNEYISDVKSKNPHNSVNGIVTSMKREYEDFEEFTNWGDDFKLVELPKILAGLSAVWSLLVSKDVSSSGKFLKPHCIQILCIMRLLSVDNSAQGVEHHLAQVLTGQGKSVILGLLSAFLAFTGHEVRVVCYSSYLANRDETDFKDFFLAFGVCDDISYGTFDDMASQLLKPEIDGQKISLRVLVKSLVLEHRPWKAMGSPTSDFSRTVLMIDEVDLFFSENVYGSLYRGACSIKVPGMPQIQEQIWTVVCGSNHEPQALYDIITRFIDENIKSGIPEFEEYNKFRLKPGSFSVLDYGAGNNLIVSELTNLSLLETHIKKMVNAAISVSRYTICGDEYRIIDGKIRGRDSINGDFR
uniref:SecA DEAD-like N-terminal domain-containing protein n=1 Tax=Lygus hesperus TaxID=30085 RepID=A0A0K8SWL7_LYGHE